jgi:hypothetical protein
MKRGSEDQEMELGWITANAPWFGLQKVSGLKPRFRSL